MLVCNFSLEWHPALYCFLPKGITPPFSLPWWVQSCEIALWITRAFFLTSTLGFCAVWRAVLQNAFLVLFPHLCNMLEWFSGPWQPALLSPWVWPSFHFAMLRDQVSHSTPGHPQIWGGCNTKLLLIVHSSWPGFCHFLSYIMNMTIRNVYIHTYMCNLLHCQLQCNNGFEDGSHEKLHLSSFIVSRTELEWINWNASSFTSLKQVLDLPLVKICKSKAWST